MSSPRRERRSSCPVSPPPTSPNRPCIAATTSPLSTTTLRPSSTARPRSSSESRRGAGSDDMTRDDDSTWAELVDAFHASPDSGQSHGRRPPAENLSPDPDHFDRYADASATLAPLTTHA